ncbi:ADP-ribosylation/crystallin J1 [uncultured Psychroserpens sp.]|uniref:ADP-ribosylation/crystallin J1 n=1 Tax=uncultured Psychroserpens sp. TaxID=255436 RepID=UPI002617F116|nr:ADP-ribosylation/crystallin J1 [uncultured Psychroserpens sp.]
MKTITLYRPIGLKELELIIASDFSKFPPRLDWQPIFYPVMNEEYACEIALKWNTTDAFSGYSGYVTAFKMNAEYIDGFEVQNVGGDIHNELWVLSEDMEVFNSQIIGKIEITKTFLGKQFKETNDKIIEEIIKNTEVRDS